MTTLIYERFILINLNQSKGETLNGFLAKGSNQANKCAYKLMKDSLLRDRIVCGVELDGTRQKLINIENLLLKKNINICRSSEAIRH